MSAWPAPSATTNVAVDMTAPLSPMRPEAGSVALMDPPRGPPQAVPAVAADPPSALAMTPWADPLPDAAPGRDLAFETAFGFSHDYDFDPATAPDDPSEPNSATNADAGPRPDGWRRDEILSSITRFLSLFWCWTIIWLALWCVVPTAVGFTPNVVTSGSMEPSIRVGSVVHVDSDVDLDTIGAGAILTFDDPAIAGLRVTHRVTGIERVDGVVTGFRTKGDANQTVDSTIVPVENVHGVARLMVPFAGTPRVWVGNGQWAQLVLFIMLTAGAAVVALDTIMRFINGRGGPGRRDRRRQAAGVAVAVTAMLGAPSSSAAFTATTVSAPNTFDMTSQWHIDAIDRESPVAHWRLGESPGGGTTVLTDDFEVFTGYNTYGAGNFVSSTAQARSGTRSGLKTGNNDPNGGWKALPATMTGSFVFDVWVYRPSGWAGGPIDRLGLEDASFNGYTFNVSHTANRLAIDRRTGGLPTAIGLSVPFDPPEDVWYRLEMVRTGAGLTLNAYDGLGALLATTSATDPTYSSFDRLVVHGGWNYYVDDLTVTQISPPLAAVDRIGTLNGAYYGSPNAGQPSLVTGDPNTSVDFDGNDDAVLIGDHALINLSDRAQRSVELWFETDRTNLRRVIYEEGGSTNGLAIYTDKKDLYAYAWSESSGWSNPLVVSVPISRDIRYHVAVTLDAVASKTLTLYVDGVAVGSSAKTDAGLWSAHSDDGAIGRVNGTSEFHDGDVTTGYHFDGTIDEVVIYNSVLSAATVANHHNAGR